jgi:hypothetical protein|tara:strand:+ start:78 stop:356 length:279 start_codon:yes stop_codon:yes gene_type:complete
MEVLYNNKFLVSILIGILISMVFYSYNKIDNGKINTLPNGEDTPYINNDNQNKDYSLYIFLIVSIIIFVILEFTQDNIDDVFNEIETGEVPF